MQMMKVCVPSIRINFYVDLMIPKVNVHNENLSKLYAVSINYFNIKNYVMLREDIL